MEFVDYDPLSAGFPLGQARPKPRKDNSFGEVLAAAFMAENDIVNALTYMARPEFEMDPNFDILGAMDAEPLALQFPKQLARAQSKDEFAAIKARILQEQRTNEILASNPVTGFITAAAAGFISPVSLIPFVGPARGLYGISKAFALAAASVSAQEALLYGLQETRTGKDVAFGIAAGTVIGGLLGSAAAYMTPLERRMIETRMADPQGDITIQRIGDDGAIETLEFGEAPPVAPAEAVVAPAARTDEPVVTQKANEADTPQQVPGEPAPLTLSRKRSSPEEALDWGGSYLRASLPNGYEIRFVKSSPGSGGAHFLDGEYALTILRPDGTTVSPAIGKEDFYNSALQGSTRKFSVKELREAVEAGELNKQIDNILSKAGEEKVFERALAPNAGTLNAAKAQVDSRGIARANTYVGKQVDRSADWLAAKGVPVLPKIIKTLNDPIGLLAKLNPMTRQLDNSRFGSARNWAARLMVPGIRIDGEQLGQGTAFSRANVHEKAVAEFLRRYDEAWAKYATGGKGNAVTRALVAAKYKATGTAPEGKLRYDQFEEAVFTYGQTGKQHEIPEVMEAIAAQRQYFDYIKKVADHYHKERLATAGYTDDVELGEEFRFDEEFDELDIDETGAEEIEKSRKPRAMFKTLEFGEGDELQNYVHHHMDHVAVEKLTPEFLADFTEHGNDLMQKSFAKDYEKFTERRARLDEAENYLELNQEGLDRVFADLDQLRENINARFANELTLEKETRAKLKAAGATPDEIKQAVAELDPFMPPEFATAMKERREIERQMTTLRRIGAGLDERQIKVLQDLEKIEDMQLNELESVFSLGHRIGQKLDRASKAEVKNDKAMAKDHEKFLVAARKVIAYEARAAKHARRNNMEYASANQTKAEKTAERAMRSLEKYSAGEGKALDIAAFKQLQRDITELRLGKAKDLNAKRAVREDALKKKAKELSPEVQAQKKKDALNEVRRTRAELSKLFDKKWQDRGGVGSPSKGQIDFLARARKDAELLHKTILGNPLRVVGIEVLSGPRGPQLQRTLNMPLEKKMKYLVRRPELVIRSHAHSMLPDMEMYRMTGSVNGASIFDEIEVELSREKAKLDLMEPGPKREAASQQLQRDYENTVRDWGVLIDRFRHQRAVPANPNGIGYRMGRFAMNLNVTRFMGMVMVSSIPDAARVTFRYGLKGTFNDAWKPLMTDLPRVKAVRAEANRFGIALDPLLHNRAHMMHDVYDNYSSRQTMVERGMEFLANKTGFVALFDRWTAEMKYLASNAVFGEFSHAGRVLANAKEFSRAEVEKAEALFRYVGIDNDTARRIWDQYMLPGGSTEFKDGFRLPNTEAWDDFDAMMALKAGVGRIVDDLIITPGLDRPSWVDENMAFKMVGQFRSFSFTATNRILISGLQEHDMAFLQGTIFSLALGAMSYYTWAAATGGKSWEEAKSADFEKVLYEAVGRSGVLAVLGEGQRIGEQIPGLNDLAIFGSDESQSRRASSLMGAVFGPSYDLAERLATVAQGASDPTTSTLRTVRTMVPYQNVVYLRQLLTMMEENLADAVGIPERRSN